METNNKPDFEKLYPGTPLNDNAKRRVEGFVWGCEKIWNDYVIVRDTKIAELERYIHQANGKIIDQFSENQALKSELEEMNNSETDLAKELFKVKSELDKAKELLKECAIELDDIEGYGVARKLYEFLKDKR